MKKLIMLAASIMLSASFAAFAKGKTVTIESLNGKNQAVKVQVPYNPNRVAILDLAALDILDNLGLGNRIVGSATTSIDYLSKYSPDKNRKIKNLGTIKQADMEAVFECEPEIIFIGGRLASSYDELSKIAPVVYLSTDAKIGLVKSINKNAMSIASIFGKEKAVSSKMAGFEKRISLLRGKVNGKTAILGMVTSGSCNLLGNTGRLNLIANEIGFDNKGAGLAIKGRSGAKGGAKAERKDSAPSHGEESSFELIAKINPEYMFILDRDSAIGTKGAKLAGDVMNNEIINMTDAAKNKKVIVLSHPAVWYTAEGGITALDYMLKDLENVIK